MRKKKHKRQRRQKGHTCGHRLVGGPFHGDTVELDARASGTMLIETSTGWASHYEKNPENTNELLFKRTAHFTEWDVPDYEWKRTSPDECCKCGKPQLGSGSEICFYPHDIEVCFRICRPCLREMNSEEHKALDDRLLDQAIKIAEKRVAEVN